MSKDKLNKDMCRYCRHQSFGCSMIDEFKLFGICGSFSRKEEADMSDCYWKNHRTFYIIVKSILWALPAIVLIAFLLMLFLFLFFPDILVVIFTVALLIGFIALICVASYRLYRFVKESVKDVE